MGPLQHHLSRVFAHDFWSDARLLDALAAAAPSEPLRLLAHVLAAQAIHGRRVAGEDPFPRDFWPALDLSACGDLLARNRAELPALLALPPRGAQLPASSASSLARSCGSRSRSSAWRKQRSASPRSSSSWR